MTMEIHVACAHGAEPAHGAATTDLDEGTADRGSHLLQQAPRLVGGERVVVARRTARIAARIRRRPPALLPALSASLPSSRWLRPWTHLRPSRPNRLLQVRGRLRGRGRAPRAPHRACSTRARPRRTSAAGVVGEPRQSLAEEPLGVRRPPGAQAGRSASRARPADCADSAPAAAPAASAHRRTASRGCRCRISAKRASVWLSPPYAAASSISAMPFSLPPPKPAMYATRRSGSDSAATM